MKNKTDGHISVQSLQDSSYKLDTVKFHRALAKILLPVPWFTFDRKNRNCYSKEKSSSSERLQRSNDYEHDSKYDYVATIV